MDFLNDTADLLLDLGSIKHAALSIEPAREQGAVSRQSTPKALLGSAGRGELNKSTLRAFAGLLPIEAETHTYLIQVLLNFLVLTTAITLISRFGTLRSRRRAIYYIHAFAIPYILFRGDYHHALLLVLGICHSIAHHLWPFLTITGLNVKESAFPDVLVHLLMHLVVHCELLALHQTLSTWTLNFSWLILAGSIWNTVLASYSKPNELWFVWTSTIKRLVRDLGLAYFAQVCLQSEEVGYSKA